MGMDGSNPVTVVSSYGLSDPFGITIDLKTSRLFWSDLSANRIESSNFDGIDRHIVARVPSAGPYGIAVLNERIYWGELGGKKLQSTGITGEDTVTMYNATRGIRHVTLVPNFNLPQNRTNHCARHTCSRVCVLTAATFRCLN